MRLERIIYSVLIIALAGLAAIQWRKAALFEADNAELRARLEGLQMEMETNLKALDLARSQMVKNRTQNLELMKLRDEVTQLRTGNKVIEPLETENRTLKAELAQLRSAAPVASPQPAGRPAAGTFPRESWTFAGYASPENALISAIWAMKEGNPRTYLDSLTPQEQQRMAQNWQDKAEAEIAEKHKSDVSSIAGLRVLEQQNLSPTEVLMNVYLEGPDRVEKIRMNQVGQDWKFGGFIREQSPAP